MFREKVFNGERLRSARIYRGMTIVELGKAIDISKQAISQFENGKNAPSFETLLKLINILKFPREYFYEDDKSKIKVGNTYFRALFTTNKKEQMTQVEKTKLLAKLCNFLDEYIQFPVLNLPEVDIENKSIEDIALEVRKYWKIGDKPIKNIVHILEKNGIMVTAFNTYDKHIDAFSQRQNINGKEYYFVVLGSDKNCSVRRQFSGAHELGHIILHEWTLDTNELSREEFKQMEKEANQFAAAFLLPREAFLNDLIYPTNLDFYVELKKKWKVSISAMIMRAYQLKAISYNQYQYLMRIMSKKGWRKKEPLDNIIVVSQPIVLKKAVEMLLVNDVFTVEELLHELTRNELTIDKREIEILLNLDKGTLKIKDNNNEIVKIKKIEQIS